MPRAEAERALALRVFGTDVLDDRLGDYRRQICRMQTDPGETIEFTIWSRRDGRALPPLPARAEACDVGCLAAGREPNLYLYEQKRIGDRLGGALCVLRRPRPDRDLATGPAHRLHAGRRAPPHARRREEAGPRAGVDGNREVPPRPRCYRRAVTLA